MQLNKLAHALRPLMAAIALVATGGVSANADLDKLSRDDKNWVMQTKDYSATHFSKLKQNNTNTVKDLKVAWTMSTGTLHGHEGAPLVAMSLS